MGLKGAPSSFQSCMNKVLSGMQGVEMFIYMDDAVVYSTSLQNHRDKMFRLLGRFKTAKLTLKPEKCFFLRKEVTYLGHLISEKGVKPDPKKVEAVSQFPRPTTKKNVRQVLGLIGYYRKFIDRFAEITKPLSNLLKDDTPFKWEDKHEQAFLTIKSILCTQPLLQYPNFEEPFLVTCDASSYAVAGVLSQGKIGSDLPIAYASRVLCGTELNYSVIEKELVAMIFSTTQFRPYLYGRKFKLITDHRPLVWLHNIKSLTSRLARWREKLRDYDYEVIHKPGRVNSNADALSRNPVLCFQETFQTMTHASASELERCIARLFVISEAARDAENELSADDGYSYFYEADTEDEEAPLPRAILSLCYYAQKITNDPNPNSSTSNIVFSRDQLTMRQDNWAHFMSIDCSLKTSVNAQLMDLEYLNIDTFKSLKLEIGAVVESGLNNGRFLYTLFSKEKYDDPLSLNIILKTLRGLYNTLIKKKIKSISIAKCDSVLKNLPWIIIEKNLATYWKGVDLTICTGEVLIPKEEEKLRIISEAHDSAVAGHKGIFESYHRVRERFFWEGMKSDISNYVKSCEICAKKKLVRVKTRLSMKITTTPIKGFQFVELDIVGPLPETVAGNKFLLTIQCNLTKYSDAIPLCDTTAEMIATAFTHEFICRFGCPEAIRTDQGSNLIGRVLSTVARLFKIRRYNSTAYHPQTQGSLERSHHSLIQYLKMFINEHSDWDTWVKPAMFSYNTSIHTAHQFSPHELIFGYKARIPSEFSADRIERSFNDYVDELVQKLRCTQAEARERLIEAKNKSKRYYDRKLNVVDFKVGDRVYLLKDKKKNKLDDEYSGIHEMIELTGDKNAKIRMNGGDVKIVHLDKLKLAFLPLKIKYNHKARGPWF